MDDCRHELAEGDFVAFAQKRAPGGAEVGRVVLVSRLDEL